MPAFDELQVLKHTSLLMDFAWSGDGRLLASTGRGPQVYVWNVAGGTLTHTVEIPKIRAVGSIAFCPTRPLLAVVVPASDGNAVDLWDLADDTKPKQTGRLQKPVGQMQKLAFHKNGRYLAVSDWHGFVHVWDIEDRKILQSIYHNGAIQDTAFSPDGNRLGVLIERNEGVLTLWKLRPPGSPPVRTRFMHTAPMSR